MADYEVTASGKNFWAAFHEIYSLWALEREGLRDGYFEKLYLKQHRFRFESLAAEITRIPHVESILDIGVSPFTYILRRLMPAADINTLDMNDIQKTCCEKYNIQFKEVDLLKEALPWPDECFDVVALAEVIEHLPCHPGPILRECWRVLKPGGTLITSTPNFACLYNRVRMLLGWHVQEMWVENDLPGRFHYREYIKSELVQEIKSSGFEILKASHNRYWDKLPCFSDMLDARYWIKYIPLGKLGIALLWAIYAAAYVPLTCIIPPFRRGINIVARRLSNTG
ncbi:MAG TPA: methyltransferase domain-containing protein [Dehalococcoidia bacterium]|nr:methyltransferase domain-containing protein [Dehalococcoidia bacterium]